MIRLPVIAYVQIVDRIGPSSEDRESALGPSPGDTPPGLPPAVAAAQAHLAGAAPVAATPGTADLRTTLGVAKLEHHLDWFVVNGYQTVTLDELVDAKPDMSSSGMKRVALTFDGGFESHYRLVFPLLQKRHMRATFFIPRDMLDKPGGLSRGEVEIMAKWGMGLGVQVPAAADLLRMLPPAIQAEVGEPRRALEAMAGRSIFLASTQARHVEGPLLRTLHAHDYRAVAISEIGNHVIRGGMFVISRYFHRKSVHMDEWKGVARLAPTGPAKALFHIRREGG